MDNNTLRFSKKIIGGVLAVSPLVGVLVLGVFQVGWKWALLLYALIAATIAVMWVGIGLWLDN